MQRGFVKKRGARWTAYYYRVDANGRRRQHTKGGFATKREAQAFLNTTLGALQTGDYVEPVRLTFGEYLTRRWLPIMEHSLRPSTWDSYRRMIDLHILPALGGVPLQAVSADHLDLLYTDLLKTGRSRVTAKTGKGLSPKTVRYVHTVIHKALRDAERKKLVARNVATAADPPKLGQTKEFQTWTGEELRRLLDALSDHRLGAAYLLAATTGMRRGEVLGLRWRDVDFKSHRLTIKQTVLTLNYRVVVGEPKTQRSRRPVALDAVTLATLQHHRRDQLVERGALGDGYDDRDLVFARLDGTPIHPDYFSQLFERTVARLGLPRIRLHDLRHTHATLGLAAGVPAKVMSDRLGHSTVAFTLQQYTHAVPALEAEAAEQMAALIFPEQSHSTAG